MDSRLFEIFKVKEFIAIRLRFFITFDRPQDCGQSVNVNIHHKIHWIQETEISGTQEIHNEFRWIERIQKINLRDSYDSVISEDFQDSDTMKSGRFKKIQMIQVIQIGETKELIG